MLNPFVTKMKAFGQNLFVLPGSLLIIFGVIFISVTSSILNTGTALSAQANTPMPTPTIDRLAEPTLPVNPGQADLGAVDYWLVCMVCHGDRGQGLTEEWRAVTGPEEMNCWQSKCHASNHPPEGFVLPRYAPQVIGTGSLARFNTAADLHRYISEKMPWQAPGALDDERYWRLTAFLIRANNLKLGTEPLSPDNAHQVILREGISEGFSTQGSNNIPDVDAIGARTDHLESDQTLSVEWYWWLGGALLLIGAIYIVLKTISN